MAVAVRLADPADAEELAAVGRLTLEAYDASGHIVEDDFYAAHLLDAETRAKEAELYVAEVDGALAGTVTFCSQGSRFAEIAAPGEGEFRMLAVAPAARRRGVAAALVDRCITRSGELGHTAVVLCSLPIQVEAHALYTRLGFRRTPEKDWSPTDTVHLIAFRLPL